MRGPFQILKFKDNFAEICNIWTKSPHLRKSRTKNLRRKGRKQSRYILKPFTFQFINKRCMFPQSLKPFCLGIVLCKRKLKFLYCWGRHCTGMKLCANKGMCVPKTDLVRIQGLPLKHDYLLLNECQAEIAVCEFLRLKSRDSAWTISIATSGWIIW